MLHEACVFYMKQGVLVCISWLCTMTAFSVQFYVWQFSIRLFWCNWIFRYDLKQTAKYPCDLTKAALPINLSKVSNFRQFLNFRATFLMLVWGWPYLMAICYIEIPFCINVLLLGLLSSEISICNISTIRLSSFRVKSALAGFFSYMWIDLAHFL